MRTPFILLFVSSILATTACTVEAIGPAPRSFATGTLQIDWSIRGVLDPNLCYQTSAVTMALVVYDARGQQVASAEPRCEAMIAGFELYPGSYYADATLLDGAGQDRSTTVATPSIEVFAGEVTAVPIDFPARSFY